MLRLFGPATRGKNLLTEKPNSIPQTIKGDDDGVFVRARFAGGRFDSHTIPFEVLPDLAAYRNLIVEVAKQLYFDRNGDRQRVPKGFAESFQLGLAKVEGGNSATVFAKRIEPEKGLGEQNDLGFPRHSEFDEARDFVDRVIATVVQTGQVPSDFPSILAGRFNLFGQSLLPGEFVELSHNGAAPIRYDTATRRKIVLSGESTYENAVDNFFVLNGGLADANVVHVLDKNNVRHNFHASSPEVFKKALVRCRHEVRLVGVGMFDRYERLTRLVEVREVIYTEDEPSQSFEQRLDEIALVPAGWYSENNLAPNTHAIATMRAFVLLITNEAGALCPYLYPTPDGGVTAEWTRDDWQISASIESPELTIELHALNVATGREEEQSIAPDAVDTLATFGIFWNKMNSEEEEI